MMREIRLFSFGEVLWDLFDKQACLGGAPFNLAAHASLCGLQSYLLTSVGKDEWGERILAEIDRLKVARKFVQTDKGHRTGTVSVQLSADGQPSYTIHEG